MNLQAIPYMKYLQTKTTGLIWGENISPLIQVGSSVVSMNRETEVATLDEW